MVFRDEALKCSITVVIKYCKFDYICATATKLLTKYGKLVVVNVAAKDATKVMT